MKYFGLILFILGLVLIVSSFAYLVLKVRKIAKAISLEIFDLKKERNQIIIRMALVVASFMMTFIAIPIFAEYTLNGLEWFFVILGSLLLGADVAITYTSFRLHYYQKNIPEKLDKWLYRIMICGFIFFAFALWILSEGYASHLTYPLVNGLSFSKGFVSPNNGTPNLAWYALCIVTGAVLVYFMCDHFAYKEWGKHGLLESTFFVAFPAGILGARIFYVVGNWNLEFANKEFWHVFAIWEGGLTILGGAIMGIVVGVLWFKLHHKDLSVGQAVNFIVPTILFAQAVGRWGNFFNCEVHGIETSMQNWMWLPSIIRNNMTYSSTKNFAAEGNIYVPLFFIESIVNLIGFATLEFGIYRGLKKHLRPFDVGFAYVAWYGATRVFMEPLRDSSFNMGSNGGWSWYWSIIFVAVGLLAISVNHIIFHIIDIKKQRDMGEHNELANIIALAVVGVISIALIIVGLIVFTSYQIPEGTSIIALVPHNIGLILWIFGLGILSLSALPIINLLKIKKAH